MYQLKGKQMEKAVINFEANIIPNDSLGGVKLRTPIKELQQLIIDFNTTKLGSFYLAGYFEARYRFGEIEICADVRNGKIFKIIAYSGYKGTLFNSIHVGMTVEQAILIEPKIYYSEAEELLLCKDVSGISLDVPEIDPPIELLPRLTIESISVFAYEIDDDNVWLKT